MGLFRPASLGRVTEGVEIDSNGNFMITKPGEYRIESPIFDQQEWQRAVANLQAMARHLQEIQVLWSAVTISLRRAWITDPVVARALRADLPSSDGRSSSDGPSGS